MANFKKLDPDEDLDETKRVSVWACWNVLGSGCRSLPQNQYKEPGSVQQVKLLNFLVSLHGLQNLFWRNFNCNQQKQKVIPSLPACHWGYSICEQLAEHDERLTGLEGSTHEQHSRLWPLSSMGVIRVSNALEWTRLLKMKKYQDFTL